MYPHSLKAMSARFLVVLVAILVNPTASSGGDAVDNSRSGHILRPLWRANEVAIYLDIGYLYSSNQPSNRLWRSKSTSYDLDQFAVNNIALAWGKESTLTSHWGFQLGLQAGADVDAGIPPEEDAIKGAEYLGHLAYSHVSYLFDTGRGLGIKAGLLPGFPGYPNFIAIDNVNYTRPYVTDYVPYFLWGVKADLPFSSKTLTSVYVVSGWDYLKSTNKIPSYGVQFKWLFAPNTNAVQNFYYGSDQEATALKYWRFATNTNLEWSHDHFLVAGSLTYGYEINGSAAGEPREEWLGAALWFQWQASKHWDFGLRPELFEDLDGMQTGYRQTIRALSVTTSYGFMMGEKVETKVRAEYRFDRSTGDEGGFYEGPENSLVPEQNLFMLSLMLRFNSS